MQPIFGAPKTAAHAAVNDELFLTAITLGIAALGIFVAFVFYGRESRIAERIAATGLYRWLAGKYYVDEFYDRLFVRPFAACAGWLARSFDPGFIDGIVNGVAASVRATSLSWRRLQSGNVQHYLFAFLAGTLLIFAYFLRW